MMIVDSLHHEISNGRFRILTCIVNAVVDIHSTIIREWLCFGASRLSTTDRLIYHWTGQVAIVGEDHGHRHENYAF